MKLMSTIFCISLCLAAALVMSPASSNAETVWCVTKDKYYSVASEEICQFQNGSAFHYDKTGLREARVEHHRIKNSPSRNHISDDRDFENKNYLTTIGAYVLAIGSGLRYVPWLQDGLEQ